MVNGYGIKGADLGLPVQQPIQSKGHQRAVVVLTLVVIVAAVSLRGSMMRVAAARRHLRRICRRVHPGCDMVTRESQQPVVPQVAVVPGEWGFAAMNLAMFKFMLKLSLFADEEDPDLAAFFAFANKYEFGSKVLPVKVYRCGTFIENYLRPVMMHFVKLYDGDRLDGISKQVRTS
ncbi:hypothetical protein HPB52_005377 [Rhipicephalus sanguineus]|uniref:Uncharacterized protein n=1 Tax=Rhipicephalus sanguineus TaxID=34632 RepID=A0A9D4PUF7_RHISA|nr:hypothetical protein HPB52_005377 [Rhipicephalus sanguineus]